MGPDYDFSSLGLQIKAHWQKYRPRMCAELEREGRLDEAVQQARDLTSEALAEALQKGVPYHQAWESVREEWAFLPSEEDERESLREKLLGRPLLDESEVELLKSLDWNASRSLKERTGRRDYDRWWWVTKMPSTRRIGIVALILLWCVILLWGYQIRRRIDDEWAGHTPQPLASGCVAVPDHNRGEDFATPQRFWTAQLCGPEFDEAELQRLLEKATGARSTTLPSERD
jgi:hypothetical protein